MDFFSLCVAQNIESTLHDLHFSISNIHIFRDYYDDVHRVSVPKPMEGERLGLTVQQKDGCVVVTRILAGGIAEQAAVIDLGDIVLEVNNIPINSAEDLMAIVSMSEKSIHFLVKKTPEDELKKYGIPNTPSLRRKINEKAMFADQKVLTHMKALYDYDPYEDNLNPCPDAGLHFQYGDILAIVNQDDPNWWQARLAEDTNAAYGPAKLIPSIELEEKRKAFVKPEADYAAKVCT